MPKDRLSVKKVEAARISTGETLLSDGDCLFLRVRPASKVWIFIYRHRGGRRKIGLGSYPTVTLASARKKATEQRLLLADGIDPIDERERKAAEASASKAAAEVLPQTVEALFDEFQRKALKSRKDGGKFARSLFDRDARPRIGGLRLGTLRRAHITDVLDAIVERGARRVAGIVLADLRQMFRWAIDREIIAADPTGGLVAAKWDTSGERDRVLSEAEIKQLAVMLPETMSEESQRMIWIMLATCCRVGEISAAAWDDVDLEAGTWLIPAAHSKNGKPHSVTLSPFALRQFQALHDAAEDAGRDVSTWVFPARRSSSPVCPKTLAKQVADRQRERDPMSHRSRDVDALSLPGGKWTPHDLRRTGATIMGELGVDGDVIEKCLNHKEQNRMKRTYQRHSRAPEMAEAWRLLGDRLDLLTRSDDNVVTLPRAA